MLSVVFRFLTATVAVSSVLRCACTMFDTGMSQPFAPERATQRGMPLPAEFLGPDGNDDGDGFRPYNEPGDGVPGARQRQRIRLPGEISIPAVVQEDVDMGPLAPGDPLPEGMMP